MRLWMVLPFWSSQLLFPGRAWGQEDPWLGKDKAQHFGLSAALALGGYAAAVPFTDRPSIRLASGAVLALSLGVGKEVADRYTGGHPSFRDLTWDLAGTATGLLTAWIIDRYLFGAPGAAGDRRKIDEAAGAPPSAPPFEVISPANVRR